MKFICKCSIFVTILYVISQFQNYAPKKTESTIIKLPVVEKVEAKVEVSAPSEPQPIPTDPEDYAHYKVVQEWGEEQWNSFSELANHEAGFDGVQKVNPTSGAYGIPQCLPVSKCIADYPDFKTNPTSQINWMVDYVKSRYGSPKEAWYFWQYEAPKINGHNWY